jgi:hypothetical protein
VSGGSGREDSPILPPRSNATDTRRTRNSPRRRLRLIKKVQCHSFDSSPGAGCCMPEVLGARRAERADAAAAKPWRHEGGWWNWGVDKGRDNRAQRLKARRLAAPGTSPTDRSILPPEVRVLPMAPGRRYRDCRQVMLISLVSPQGRVKYSRSRTAARGSFSRQPSSARFRVCWRPRRPALPAARSLSGYRRRSG